MDGLRHIPLEICIPICININSRRFYKQRQCRIIKMGNPIVYTPGSIEVQQTRIKEGEFYGSYFNEYRSLKNGKKELERTGLCNGSFFIFRQFVNFFISKM